MTRTRRFLRGVGAGYLNQALVTLVGLWLVRFLLFRLGQHDYGLWLVAGQLLGYLALLDLGVVALLPREAAYATGRAGGDHTTEELPDVVGKTARIVLWQTPVVAVAAALVWIFLPASWAALRTPLGIVLVAFTVTFPLRIFEHTLRGLQDLAFLGFTQTGAWLLNNSVMVLLVLAGAGLTALAVGWTLGQLAVATTAFVRLRSRYPNALPHRLPRLPREGFVKRMTGGLWVSLSQVSHVLLSGSDVLLIGAILGPAAAVPYAITGKLINVLANQPQMLLHAAEPGLSELRTAESRERILGVGTALTESMLMFSGGLLCMALAVNEGFVHWWVGAAQWGGLLLTALILARVLCSHWNLTVATALFCFGYERRLAITGLANGAVTIAASIVLLHAIGILGAPLAAVIGTLLVSMPAHLVALGRETGTRVRRLLAPLGSWLWRFLLVLGLAWATAIHGLPAQPFVLAAAGAGIGLVYLLLMLPRFTAPPLESYLHPRLHAMLARLPAPLRAGTR